MNRSLVSMLSVVAMLGFAATIVRADQTPLDRKIEAAANKLAFVEQQLTEMRLKLKQDRTGPSTRANRELVRDDQLRLEVLQGLVKEYKQEIAQKVWQDGGVHPLDKGNADVTVSGLTRQLRFLDGKIRKLRPTVEREQPRFQQLRNKKNLSPSEQVEFERLINDYVNMTDLVGRRRATAQTLNMLRANENPPVSPIYPNWHVTMLGKG